MGGAATRHSSCAAAGRESDDSRGGRGGCGSGRSRGVNCCACDGTKWSRGMRRRGGSRRINWQSIQLECQKLLPQILLWLHCLFSAGLRRRGALLPPPPASAAGRFRDRSDAQTGGRWWSVGQIGLGKAAAAPRHDASSFRCSSARGKLFASRASFERQKEAFEILSLLGRSGSKPFLGGRPDGADRASKKATEVSTSFFFGPSVNV